ncbi:MAG: hypothetical protein Q8O76_15400, partial [Chloroflexota bacterium]|nr:hypothetical protein [Chloroflexota bacterium]
LRVIDTVLPSSTAHLIANKDALREPWKAGKIREMQRALEGVVRARHSFHIFVNVPLSRLEEAKKVVPAMKEVSTLRGEKWARIDFVVAKRDFRDVLMALKALGAEDILRYSPGQVIL